MQTTTKTRRRTQAAVWTITLAPLLAYAVVIATWWAVAQLQKVPTI